MKRLACFTFFLISPFLARAGTLYLAFQAHQSSLGIFTTDGATVTSQSRVDNLGGTSFNAVGEGAGLGGIVTRAAQDRDFDTRTFNGILISSFENSTPVSANYGDLAGNGTELWSANFLTPGGCSCVPSLYKIDPANGSTLEVHAINGAGQLEGLTFVGSQLWASDYANGNIGIVDTLMNVFVPVFTVPDKVAGLAYDSVNGVLWVGGDRLTPYNLAGATLGSSVDLSALFGGSGSAGEKFTDSLAFFDGQVAESNNSSPSPEPVTGTLTFGGLGLVLAGMEIRRLQKKRSA